MKTRIQLLSLALFLAVASAWAYTAQFHAGASSVEGDFSISEASDGAGVTLPTPTLSGCTGWEFAGWIVSGVPYELSEEMTQTLYKAGSVYRLTSISEDFYAVYRHKTNRYTEIYVNDQLTSGDQYLVVNTDSYNALYFNPSENNHVWGYSLEGSFSTWSNGYVMWGDPLGAAYRTAIPVAIEERDATNHYWSLFNSTNSRYVNFTNQEWVSSYSNDARCSISRTNWNTFNLTGVNSSEILGKDNVQTGSLWIIITIPFYQLNSNDFYIYRQQTFYSSTPDCGTPNYTVTFNPGDNGSVSPASDIEKGYHQGVVLPAATPNTGGAKCNAQWEFAGWTESGSALSKDSARLPKRLFLEGEVYYPTRNETLHAVYRRKTTTWEKVIDLNTLQAGENIIIAYKNGSDYYALSSAAQSTGYNASVAVSGSAIATVDNAAIVWRLEGTPGAWRLKDSNNKHLDLTRGDYAYSYTYPWSCWSDEFTISGETDFSIRSNYADKRYLKADATKFSSQAAATSNIHIYRQVTKYSKTPKCNEVTLLFNSGEGTFDDVVNATVAIEDVTTDEGIRLNDSRIPTPVAPDCRRWKFAGWRVGTGLNATTDAPGVLYKSTDTYIPTQDSITLYAVYQDGDGYIYYEKVNTKSEVTSGGTYMILYSGNNYAVTYSGSKTEWTGTGGWNISDNKISEEDNTFTTDVQWSYNGTYFYNVTNNTSRRLAYNGETQYAGAVTNNNAPFTLLYTTKTGFIFTTTHYYYLNWGSNKFTYTEDGSNKNFNIYKQKTTATVYNSWPHCTPFELVLNSCGGKFTTVGDTHNPKESNAGDGVVLTSHTPTSECAGWTLVGWVEEEAVQARNSAPTGMIATNATYVPKQDKDQLYAVYRKTGENLWSSYPACGEGVEIVAWAPDSIIVESYVLTGVPKINGVNGRANGDGTYTLNYNVEGNPCKPILIEWGGVTQMFQTPLLVDEYTRLSAVTGAVSAATCANCDLIVLGNGTAIADQTTANVRNVAIYPGGRLNLASGKTINAASLTMRTEGDQLAPSAVIQGTLGCSQLYHERRIDASRYYWMALPYDVTISNIDFADEAANNGKAVYDTDFYIKYYDGVLRATDKGTSETYWTHIGDIEDETYQTKSTLNAGRGYLIGLPKGLQAATGHKHRTLRFPMTVSDWSDETSVTKTVMASGADCDWPQHIGWNLIGNPFLQNYSAVSVSDVACGKLTKNLENDIWVEPWYTLEEGTTAVPYITLYDPVADEYTQTEMIGQNLAPFSAAFVQLPGSVSGIRFVGTAVSKNSAPARRMGLLNEDNRLSRFCIRGLSSSSDKFSLIISDQHDASYEVGADLLKMRNNGKTNIYTHHNDVAQVYDALGYDDLDYIPLGYMMPAAGNMMIAAQTLQVADDIEHVWLIDEETGAWTDLLTDTYVFSSEAGTYNNRLWIRVQTTNKVPTAVPNQYINSSDMPRKVIRDGRLLILREDDMYDALGTKVQ